MSNYLHYLLTKELDTDAEIQEKQYVPRFCHPILSEGEDGNKKKDIEENHVA